MKPAIFLDRDGVIIENNENYIRSWRDVILLPNALKALSDFVHKEYYFIIVTNQSVVGRNIISQKKAKDINKKLLHDIFQTGGHIDKVYMCIHAPKDNCTCRKPKAGMILQAQKEFNIDLKNSIMIGDALTDIEAGQSAGIKNCGLVMTGRGKQQLKISSSLSYSVHKNLYHALDYYFSDSANRRSSSVKI